MKLEQVVVGVPCMVASSPHSLELRVLWPQLLPHRKDYYLYIPNLYKISGELLPTVIHVASRALAGEALSIYGDHSDTMLVRGCGLAMLSSFSVQEAHDMAVIAQVATLESRVPFLHFMDGFRTSHEINKIELVSDEQLRDLMPYQRIEEHRQRGLSPMHPT